VIVSKPTLSRRRAAYAAHLAAAAIALAISLGLRAQPVPIYSVYAVRFAHAPYPVSSLVAGAERGRSVDLAFTVWVVRAEATPRIILVDSGFYRDKFLLQWHPMDYVRPDAAITDGLGLGPDRVTDVVISHSHWDHADGADLFPRARIWIQREEYEYYVGAGGEVLHRGGVDAEDAKMLMALNEAGRVELIDGDDRAILPGISVYTGGKHTFASQFVTVATRAGTVVLASDNVYLYENLDKHVAIAQTLDAASNLAAQDRMRRLASAPRLLIPGHDPAVFDRFPVVKPGVVRID
jgi:glyoxylase-like metal-dependent hydrolase (beta-lactamase superfamily II)